MFSYDDDDDHECPIGPPGCSICRSRRPEPEPGCPYDECMPDAEGVFYRSCTRRAKAGTSPQCKDCPGAKRVRLGRLGEIEWK